MNIKDLKVEIHKLVVEGWALYARFAVDTGKVGEVFINNAEKQLGTIPKKFGKYESQYTIARGLVARIAPERLDDFQRLYRDPKRKNISFESYGVANAMIGLGHVMDHYGPSSALPKLEVQINILESLEKVLESKLFNLRSELKAEIYDSEIEEAEILLKRGHLRAAGAVAGVVLEGHLGEVCASRTITLRKRSPSISDYNDALKSARAIETPTWRRIQHLADLRNLCDHAKGRESNKEEIDDLIGGTKGIIKNVF